MRKVFQFHSHNKMFTTTTKFKIPKVLENILNDLQELGATPILVGGCVRDFFMNKPCNDIDITTSAKPIELEKILTDNNSWSIIVNERRYTALARHLLLQGQEQK